MIAAVERSGRTLVVCCASSVWDTGGEQVCSSRNSSNAPCQPGSVRSARHGREEVILSGIQGVAENRSKTGRLGGSYTSCGSNSWSGDSFI